MTKEELLTLANEMGITVIHGIIKQRTEVIEAFANLVAAKEREEILAELRLLLKVREIE